jgi:proline dehydrogenase
MKLNELISFDNTAVAFASKSDKELKKMQLLFSIMHWEYLTKIGTKIVNSALNFNFPVRNILKNTLFNQFCGGETLQECEPVIHQLRTAGIYTILDYSVEGEDKEENFEKNLNILEQIIELDAASDSVIFTVLKISSIAAPYVLEKVQQGNSLSYTENEIFEKIKTRLDRICRKAYEKKVKLLIDAEESWIQGTTDVLVYSMMRKYNKDAPYIFNTYQMYRVDMGFNLKSAIKMAKQDHFHLGVKLVRGAYLTKERSRAEKSGYKDPLFKQKKETDEAFNETLGICLDNLEMLELCCGTHNEESNLLLVELMRRKNIAPADERITFAQLYGMGDHISYNLAIRGYRAAKYLPFGPLNDVLPYLFRRAEENNSIAGQNDRQLQLIKKEIQRRKSS